MSKVKIVAPGLLTTIQDAGRYRYQQSGMSVSGVMDSFSHRTANILVGNSQDEAVLEATLTGPTLEFLGDSAVAVTGAVAAVMLNGRPAAMWQSLPVKQGDVLSFGPITGGARLYIAFAGGIDVPVVMGSKSTYIKARVGGLEGRALKAGDVLALNPLGIKVESIASKAAHPRFIPEYSSKITLRVVLGPQDDYFTSEGIETFLNTPYTVTNECDRMGYRLEGEAIAHKDGGDIISDGIVMGAVQVPGNGKPIILMADRQTTGGYTKIATVISADLPLVSQARPGNTLHFQAVSVEEAQEILFRQEGLMKQFQEELQPAPARQADADLAANPPQVQAGCGTPVREVRQYRISVDGNVYDVRLEVLE